MTRLSLVMIAAALLLGGAAAAADYKAPRNALGQPDLQGVWNTHFFMPMEARPDMPSLILPEAEAAAYARKLNDEAGKLAVFTQDPEVAEIRADPSRSSLAIVRGQRRTRQVVQPTDGMLPLTRGARGQMRFIEQALRTQTEPPFQIAQAVVLMLFAVFTIGATLKFHPVVAPIKARAAGA